VFRDGKDKDGRPFPRYSEKYQELLERDFKRIRDGKRIKGYEGRKLETSGKKRATRNPVLTGRTSEDIKVRGVAKDYFILGWRRRGDIVRGLEGMDRDFINDIPKKDWNFLLNQFGKSIDRQWRKLQNVNITVGK
jgi:hypothetical protein